MRIKERREYLNMSTRALADKVGISCATVSRYENGIVKKIDEDKLLRFCVALSCTPEYLLEKDVEPELDLPEGLISFKGSFSLDNIKYMYTITDDSMEATILKDTTLFIKSQRSYKNGDIVCVQVGNSVLIRAYNMVGSNLFLTPLNISYTPICVQSHNDIKIFGKCLWILKKL